MNEPDLGHLTTLEHRAAVLAATELAIDCRPALARLCRLALSITGAAEASISLVADVETMVVHACRDDHEGIRVDLDGESVPLDDSFCRVPVASRAPFTVDDARQHPLTDKMPCVVAAESRSYAGVPLRDPNGWVVGTLCIYGPSVSTFDDGEIDRLTDLVQSVETELALRAEQGALARSNRRLASALASAERALRECSLTGVANRAGIVAELERRMALDAAATTAVCFIDLDHFKSINDRHGHMVGDRVLRIIADRLRAVTRASDLVGRLGGDEFVVVVDLGPLSPHQFVERIRAAVSAPMRIGAESISVGCSVGVHVVGAAPTTDPAVLLDLADQAMFADKMATSGAAV